MKARCKHGAFYPRPEETGFYGADDKIFVLAVKKQVTQKTIFSFSCLRFFFFRPILNFGSFMFIHVNSSYFMGLFFSHS
jgi:hypothetical protein